MTVIPFTRKTRIKASPGTIYRVSASGFDHVQFDWLAPHAAPPRTVWQRVGLFFWPWAHDPLQWSDPNDPVSFDIALTHEGALQSYAASLEGLPRDGDAP